MSMMLSADANLKYSILKIIDRVIVITAAPVRYFTFISYNNITGTAFHADPVFIFFSKV